MWNLPSTLENTFWSVLNLGNWQTERQVALIHVKYLIAASRIHTYWKLQSLIELILHLIPLTLPLNIKVTSLSPEKKRAFTFLHRTTWSSRFGDELLQIQHLERTPNKIPNAIMGLWAWRIGWWVMLHIIDVPPGFPFLNWLSHGLIWDSKGNRVVNTCNNWYKLFTVH